jgi:hypothetical protein
MYQIFFQDSESVYFIPTDDQLTDKATHWTGSQYPKTQNISPQSSVMQASGSDSLVSEGCDTALKCDMLTCNVLSLYHGQLLTQLFSHPDTSELTSWAQVILQGWNKNTVQEYLIRLIYI